MPRRPRFAPGEQVEAGAVDVVHSSRNGTASARRNHSGASGRAGSGAAVDSVGRVGRERSPDTPHGTGRPSVIDSRAVRVTDDRDGRVHGPRPVCQDERPCLPGPRSERRAATRWPGHRGGAGARSRTRRRGGGNRGRDCCCPGPTCPAGRPAPSAPARSWSPRSGSSPSRPGRVGRRAPRCGRCRQRCSSPPSCWPVWRCSPPRSRPSTWARPAPSNDDHDRTADDDDHPPLDNHHHREVDEQPERDLDPLVSVAQALALLGAPRRRDLRRRPAGGHPPDHRLVAFRAARGRPEVGTRAPRSTSPRPRPASSRRSTPSRRAWNPATRSARRTPACWRRSRLPAPDVVRPRRRTSTSTACSGRSASGRRRCTSWPSCSCSPASASTRSPTTTGPGPSRRPRRGAGGSAGRTRPGPGRDGAERPARRRGARRA